MSDRETSSARVSNLARPVSPGALNWSFDVVERFGTALHDGRVLVPCTQADLSELSGWGRNHGGVSRRIAALRAGDPYCIVATSDGLIFDLDRLKALASPPGSAVRPLHLLPSGSPRGPARHPFDEPRAERSDGVAQDPSHERLHQLEELVAVQDALLDALLGERALLRRQLGLEDARIRSAERADPRVPLASSSLFSSSIDKQPARASFFEPARVRAGRADPPVRRQDWEDDELEDLLGELLELCAKCSLPGLSFRQGVLVALRDAGWTRDEVIEHQGEIVRRIAGGCAVHSPFGLLVEMARGRERSVAASPAVNDAGRAMTSKQEGHEQPPEISVGDKDMDTEVAHGAAALAGTEREVAALELAGGAALEAIDEQLALEPGWELLRLRPRLLHHARVRVALSRAPTM
jgi:hypothetical protein